MDNEVILGAVAQIESKFQVNLQSIMQDDSLGEEEKQILFFKKLLTAKLNEVVEKRSAEPALADFNVESYVDEQAQLLGSKGIKYVANIGLMKHQMEPIINARGNDVKEQVKKIFRMATEIIERGTDEEKIAAIVVESGFVLFGALGAGAAITAALATKSSAAAAAAAAGTAVVAGATAASIATAAAITGAVLAGVVVLISIAALIVTILAMINKTAYGIVLNNTLYDLYVDEAISKKMANVYIKHGNVNSLMYSEETDSIKVHGKVAEDGEEICFIGLIRFDKDPIVAYGSSGTIRFNHGAKGDKKVDLQMACPYSNNNRMLLTTKFTNMKLDKKSHDAIADMWYKEKKRTEYTEEAGNITYTGRVDSHKSKPSYGIAIASS